MNRKDFFAYVFWFIFFIAVFIWASSLFESAAYWPKMVSLIGAVLSGFGMIRYGLARRKDQSKSPDKTTIFTKPLLLRSGFLLVTVSLWILMMKLLGFLVSSLFAVNAVVLFFQTRRDFKKRALHFGITSVLVIGMYFVFQLLGVRFPAGIFI